MTLNSVDLPQPDGPITPTNSPGLTSNETWSTATIGPSGVSKRLTMSSTTRMARSGFGAVAGPSLRLTNVGAVAISSSSPAFPRRCYVVPASVGLAGERIPHRAGAVARLDAHVDHRHFALLDRCNRLGDRLVELGLGVDRTESARALRPSHASHVDLRIEHLLADPLVL